MIKGVQAHLPALAALTLAACMATRDASAQSPRPSSIPDLFPAELFAPAPEQLPPRSDLVVVFWFERRDPLGTLRHQVYDRRKGEYTPAVDAWFETIRRDFPDYATDMRYIDVGKRDVAAIVREAVEKERDELVLRIVKRRAMAEARPFLGFGYTPSPARASSPRHRISINRSLGSSGTSPAPGLSYSFPTPFPYPRPHP